MHEPSATSKTAFNFKSLFQLGGATETYAYNTGMGYRDSGAIVDAVRFLFSSGNITSGRISLYGVRHD